MRLPRARGLHRLFGLLLLLPLIGWCATGLLFHLKPGWSAAYEMPSLRFEPLGELAAVTPREGWLELRHVRTALGEHLLVRTLTGHLHLDPVTGLERQTPSAAELRLLLEAPLAGSPRYGALSSVDGLTAVTETGVELSLDWMTLRLSQRGRDTSIIDGLYRVHYLQWTGVGPLDQALAVAGLLGLAGLSLLGLRLAVGSKDA